MIKLGDLLKENADDAYKIGMKTYKTSKPKLSQNESEKKKGVDGKPCWRGYRYAGTENGKDKCVPIKESGQMCKECGSPIYEEMCQECGYMEEATFTSKYDDDPKLKGGQKDLPDELQAKVLNKEATEREFEIDDNVKITDPDSPYYGKMGTIIDMSPSESYFLVSFANGKRFYFPDSDLRLTRRPSISENEDHEVGMAQNLLQDIIRNAQELMQKIGNQEINLPGWIQDHISQAQNYIDQANVGYHTLGEENY